MMDFETFRQNVELYSGDLSRWPQQLIRAAAQLADQDPKARALLESHVSFDAAMRQYAPTPAAERLQALESRILRQIAVTPQGAETAGAAPHEASSSRGWRPALLVAPGGGLIAAALIGFLIGFHPQPQKDILLDPGYYNVSQVVASNDAAADNVDIDTDGDGDNDGGIF